ncbi:MAG TPA: hypothetical protein VFV52_15940 [Bacilli bacterium]|nr:hypothetical protein [Bacilli bacterium]
MEMKLPILIRWPNEESGGHFKVPGCLVGPNTALALFDQHLEVHLVVPSPEPHEYDLRYASNPMFYVGDDVPTIFHDLAHLTFADFTCKYTHSDFQQVSLPLS